jgi:predicted ATPase/DNA-binding SARP family transcriptional activator/class 3 adenylate cyclase
VEFRILGPLQVLEGERELPLDSPKERSLLAVLLLHAGAVVSRERLIEELWGESPPPTAGKALNVHVSRLRKALARNGDDAIVTRTPGYALELEPKRLDAARFERLVAEARGRTAAGDMRSAHALLREALALWRGPALAGVELESAARNEVGRLEELRLAAEMDRIDCELALGLHEQLISELEALVAEHPLRERLRGQLMLALYRSGRQADALRRYRETRATLVEELGIEPSLPLQRLENAILNQDPSLEAPPGAAHAAVGLETVSPLSGGERISSVSEFDPVLPAGTVTFLLTDVEGSTGLWEAYPEAMGEAMARQRAIAVETIERHDGRLPKDQGEGDSVLAAFARAPDSVACALELQRALLTEDWPDDVRVRVRVALHTGEAKLRDGNYYGAALNRCAWLRAIAHGDQVLLSQVAAELTRDHLPAGAALLDLGEHRLKDVARAERVFQLAHPDLPADFPPLRSLRAQKHNLPAQLTSFIGREQEIAELKDLLATTRLVTLTGAGGSGKTRLALQVAGDLVSEYPDGVWLVELAALSDAKLVGAVVARALGVQEEPSRPLVETLTDTLRAKRLLLVLDNCEHLLAACAGLAEGLLQACPQITVLATSRQPLAIAGETAWAVPTLSVPAAAETGTVDALASEAVRLFIERARSANRTFTPSGDGTAAIVEICRRLDGIPLAIELAAARVRLLTPEQIATRLDDRFALLTDGSRTALPRHRTLRALIDWSYELLFEQEQLLLRRLSVFAGDFGLEAAESVCAGEGIAGQAVLDLLAQLVDKSLVVAEEQHAETRYRLLETVREFARERLDASDQDAPLARRHAGYYRASAEDARAEAERSGDARRWSRLAQAEHDNLRAALDFYAASGETTNEIRLATVLGDFWILRGYYAEGRRRLEGILARRSDRDALRATALNQLHRIVLRQHDLEEANAVGSERLALARQLGDRRGVAWTLVGLANAASTAGDIDAARRMLGEAESLFRALDETMGVVVVANDAGELALLDGDFAAAAEQFNAGLALHERVGRPGRTLRTGLAHALLLQGRLNDARPLYRQVFEEAVEIGHTVAIADALLGAAAVCDADAGDPTAAARLLGAAESLLGETGVEFDRADSMLRDRIAGRIEALLDATDLARALDDGRNLHITEAVDLALQQLR